MCAGAMQGLCERMCTGERPGICAGGCACVRASASRPCAYEHKDGSMHAHRSLHALTIATAFAPSVCGRFDSRFKLAFISLCASCFLPCASDFCAVRAPFVRQRASPANGHAGMVASTLGPRCSYF
eukprot:6184209-Pleurochrysis_carterae.AAC.1